MNETAAMADLIMPNHCFLERYEDVVVAAGLPRPTIGLAKPVIDPLYNTRHVGDAIIAIARGLGGNTAAAFSWDSYQGCLEETLGDKWDALNESVYWEDTEYRPPEWTTGFETGSGKFEFPSVDILNQAPIGAEGDQGTFPLLLVPTDSIRLASGYIGASPFLIKTLEDTVLKDNDTVIDINPATAADLGLRDGHTAALKTPKGSARVRIHLFDGIKPGALAMTRGLGHQAHDAYLAGKGTNINNLIGPVPDPKTGLDAAWGIRASLTKA
jgi:anaerobic selenocysteine-containing dehydrogenase